MRLPESWCAKSPVQNWRLEWALKIELPMAPSTYKLYLQLHFCWRNHQICKASCVWKGQGIFFWWIWRLVRWLVVVVVVVVVVPVSCFCFHEKERLLSIAVIRSLISHPYAPHNGRWSCASFWWSPCRYQASTNLLPRTIHSWPTCWDPTAWYWWLCFCFGMFCCSSTCSTRNVFQRHLTAFWYTHCWVFCWCLGSLCSPKASMKKKRQKTQPASKPKDLGSELKALQRCNNWHVSLVEPLLSQAALWKDFAMPFLLCLPPLPRAANGSLQRKRRANMDGSSIWDLLKNTLLSNFWQKGSKVV